MLYVLVIKCPIYIHMEYDAELMVIHKSLRIMMLHNTVAVIHKYKAFVVGQKSGDITL